MTFEIPPSNWAQFCEKLSLNRGVHVDIRVQEEDQMRALAEKVPLRSIVYEPGDACNSSLIIEFGAGDGLRRYCVIEPVRFVLRKEGHGDHYPILEVPSESGTTVISLHPGISPALLAELKAPHPA